MTTPDPRLLSALHELLGRRPVLLALDFDGVLAPLVDEPLAARALPGTLALLTELAACDGVYVALVSGRALANLRTVGQVPADTDLLLVGSHGAEVDGVAIELEPVAAQRLSALHSAFDAIAAEHPGVHVETKPAGVVLHTRRATTRGAAATATQAALTAAAGPGCTVTRGKEVVEVSVVEAGKGVAVERLRERLGVLGVLYVGDDVTDENAFAVLGSADVGIKVGEGATVAAHRLPDPPAVQHLLRLALAALTDPADPARAADPAPPT